MATMQIELTATATAEPAAVLTTKDVAQMLSLSLDTVRAMRLGHDGPTYTQFADGRIRYSVADVFKFQALRSAAYQRLMNSFGKRYLPC
jgi:hypothetical protein